MKSLWLARDLGGGLCLYSSKPRRDARSGIFTCEGEKIFQSTFDDENHVILDCDSFPEVTWENSPQKLTINKSTKK